MEMEFLYGVINLNMLASSIITRLKGKDNFFGQMEEAIQETGKIITWRVMDNSLGQMEKNILDLT